MRNWFLILALLGFLVAQRAVAQEEGASTGGESSNGSETTDGGGLPSETEEEPDSGAPADGAEIVPDAGGDVNGSESSDNQPESDFPADGGGSAQSEGASDAGAQTDSGLADEEVAAELPLGSSAESGGSTRAGDLPSDSDDSQVEAIETPRVGDFLRVNGTENWEYSLDISDYADGKYNLVVRGIDNAGNIYTTPAIDVNIDQESDRPTVSISNPLVGDTVRGNLNILGTANDDDAITRVEVRVGDGDFEEANGTDYWSYNLLTEELDDGLYEIHVRAIDVNEIVGDEVSVVFNLDNDKPIFQFISHENGALVNARITVTGTVSDLNGISLLQYGTERDDIGNRIRFSSDRAATTAEFELRLDTRDLEDGAHVYWFEASDKMGSVGTERYSSSSTTRRR